MVIIKIPRREYNALRSFVESSKKTEYLWNKPVYAQDCTRYGTGKNWLVTVCSNERSLMVGSLVLRLLEDEGKVIIAYNDLEVVCSQLKCRIASPEGEAEASELNTFFTSDVPFARLISVFDILSEMMHYRHASFTVKEIDVS